jgi:hypothetical protein
VFVETGGGVSTSAFMRAAHAATKADQLSAALQRFNGGSHRQNESGIISVEHQIEAATQAVPHPLGPPTLSGTTYTVDWYLNQPTRITRMIMDLTLQRFLANKIFASAGGVTGGAVVYDEAVLNELYLTRDIEKIAPGMEVPIVTSDRQQPKIAVVEKWGGKTWISDEARDRNNSAAFAMQIRQLGNTVVRKLNQRAIEVLEASITASGQTATGRNWSTATDTGPDAGTTTRQNMPLRDFALAQRMADEDELGVRYTLWIINPQEYANLVTLYDAGLDALLRRMNIDLYVSNRVTAGTAYVVAGSSTGEMRIEKPLATRTWREEGRERTWVQTTVRPVMYVTNPYAVLKFTGLAG